MLRPLLTRILVLAFLGLILTHCTTEPAGNPGPVTDTSTAPSPTPDFPPIDNSAGAMFDPLDYEYFDFYTRRLPYPFRPEFFRARFIESVRIDVDRVSGEGDAQEVEKGMLIEMALNDAGEVALFERTSFSDGEGLDSVRLEYIYDEGLQEIRGRSVLGDFVVERVVEERGEGLTDPQGMSVFTEVDPAKNWRYETHYNPAGGGFVKVYGPEGSFPDEVALDVQADFAARFSPFFRFDLATGLSEVTVIEENAAGQPVREVEFDNLDAIFGIHTYTYNDEGQPVEKKFEEAEKSGKITTLNWIYGPSGELREVRFRENDPGTTDNFKSMHLFSYAPNGSLTKIEHFKTRGLGSPDLYQIDNYSYEARPEVP